MKTTGIATIKDIVPGRVLHEVDCCSDLIPSYSKFICTSHPIVVDLSTFDGIHKTSLFVNGISQIYHTFSNEYMDYKSQRSLRDQHIESHIDKIKHVYNLHRWFVDKDSADKFIKCISDGVFEDTLDQQYYNDVIKNKHSTQF